MRFSNPWPTVHADGVQTLYNHGKGAQLRLRDPQSAIRNFGDVWQLSLSAKEFTALVGKPENSHVDERPDQYVISYATATEETNSSLVKAALVLNRADLHPIEQTLLIKQGNETREFRFVEAAFERWAPAGISPSTFEPDAELLSSTTPNARNLKPETVPTSPLPLSPLLTVASADLEIEVLRLLSGVGADLGEEVSVQRTPEGQLLVEGVVDTDRRKSEILQTLRPVTGNHAVKLNVITTAEAARRAARPANGAAPMVLQPSEPTESKLPAQAELERYFKNKGLAGEQLNTEVLRFADRTLSRSRQVLLRAGALKRLTARFSLG